MARPRKYVRVIEQPDGTIVRAAKKNEGREIHGLSYHKSSGSYYTIDPKTGNREYRGTDLEKAVASVENVNVFGKPQTWTPERWKEHEREVEKSKSHAASVMELQRLAIQMPHGEVRRLIVDGGRSTAPTDEKLSGCLKLWLVLPAVRKRGNPAVGLNRCAVVLNRLGPRVRVIARSGEPRSEAPVPAGGPQRQYGLGAIGG